MCCDQIRQTTHGPDRFFSSLFGKPVSSVALFALSLISVRERCSYPVLVEQIVQTEVEKADAKQKAEAKRAKKKKKKKGKPGGPKDSQNRNKAEVTLTPELRRIQEHQAKSQKSLLFMGAESFPSFFALRVYQYRRKHLVSKSDVRVSRCWHP
jgi:hypothetical protein